MRLPTHVALDELEGFDRQLADALIARLDEFARRNPGAAAEFPNQLWWNALASALESCWPTSSPPNAPGPHSERRAWSRWSIRVGWDNLVVPDVSESGWRIGRATRIVWDAMRSMPEAAHGQ